MSLATRLAELVRAPIATWVLDPEELRILWANDSALGLWRADSAAELCARSMAPTPVSVRTRLDAARSTLLAGRTHVEDIVIYPKGVPVEIRLYFSPLFLEDGRLLFLQQGIPRERAEQPEKLRMLEAFLHGKSAKAWVTFAGEVLLMNPAAVAAFGAAADRWPDWLQDRAVAQSLLCRVQVEEQVSAQVQVRTLHGPRIHRIDLIRLRDAVTAELAVLIQHTDDTARQQAEAEAQTQGQLRESLERALARIEEQHQKILALSAPLLDVGDGVLALPLTGELSALRASVVGSELLTTLCQRRCRVVIVDLTGAGELDGTDTPHLLRWLAAVRLLGIRPMLCGIQAGPAHSLVQAGFAAATIPIARNLSEALHKARQA